MIDLILASLHHLLVFSLVALLAMERALLNRPVRGVALARLDSFYGASALGVLAVGAARVVFGGKGWTFYAGNPFFWGKMAAFLAIGLFSVGSTLLFLKWRKAAEADAERPPPAAEIRQAKLWLGLQGVMLVPLLACAAAMARWPF